MFIRLNSKILTTSLTKKHLHKMEKKTPAFYTPIFFRGNVSLLNRRMTPIKYNNIFYIKIQEIKKVGVLADLHGIYMNIGNI